MKVTVKNIIFILMLQYFLINAVFALESNSSSFVSNSYFGMGASTSNSSSFNVSAGFGQIMIGNSSSSNYTVSEGIFYISNQSISNAIPVIPPSCDGSHLDLCLNESACVGAGGYWWSDSCHNYAQGGGSGPGGVSVYPKYMIYPNHFYETLNKNAILETEFYIENLEYSSPLRIEITSTLQIYNKVFDIAPGRRATVRFSIDGFNKSGYYNESISVRVQKNPTSYRIGHIDVEYYVRQPTQFDMNATQNQTVPSNKTFFDLLPFIGNNTQIKEDIKETVKAADTFFSHPLFFIVIFSLLVISIVIIQQYSKDKDVLDPVLESRSPWAYVIGGIAVLGLGGLIWWLSTQKYAWAMVRSWYTHPVFFIVVLSLLGIMAVIMLQLKKPAENSFKWGKALILAVIAGLFLWVFRNSKLLSRFLYNLPNMTHSWWFYVVILSLLIIVIVIVLQLRKKSEDGGTE